MKKTGIKEKKYRRRKVKKIEKWRVGKREIRKRTTSRKMQQDIEKETMRNTGKKK